LSSLLGCRIELKVETLNPIRSFKGRGASFFVHEAPATLAGQRLVCASAGNWGQAELVDWHAIASSHGGITTDGIHLTTKGIDLYSRLIASSVRTAARKHS